MSNALDAKQWAGRIAPTVADRVAGKPAFEVQAFCFDFAREQFEPSPEQKAQLQAVAYDNGIDLDAVLDVLAIELRDVLLGAEQPPTERDRL